MGGGKGSFLNKLILVPAALLISAFAPPLITVLLVIGGLYLCFEGSEKLADKYLHSTEEKHEQHLQKLAAVADANVDLVALEKDKIKEQSALTLFFRLKLLSSCLELFKT